MNGLTVNMNESVLDSLLKMILLNSGLRLSYTVDVLPGPKPLIVVHFDGPDLPQLLIRSGELLLALEHMAVKALRLRPDQHDLISFDAGDFKASRDHVMQLVAQNGIGEVERTGKPFHFQPMSPRERRDLHLLLTPSGLPTLSQGDGSMRHLVLHPRVAETMLSKERGLGVGENRSESVFEDEKRLLEEAVRNHCQAQR